MLRRRGSRSGQWMVGHEAAARLLSEGNYKQVNVMTSILVVDDSATDRRMVGGLLERHPDFLVEYAEDGMERACAKWSVLDRISWSPILTCR